MSTFRQQLYSGKFACWWFDTFCPDESSASPSRGVRACHDATTQAVYKLVPLQSAGNSRPRRSIDVVALVRRPAPARRQRASSMSARATTRPDWRSIPREDWLAENKDEIEVRYLPNYRPAGGHEARPGAHEAATVKATPRHLRSVQRQPERVRATSNMPHFAMPPDSRSFMPAQ